MEYTSTQLEEAYKNSSEIIKKILNDPWLSDESGKVGQEMSLRVDRIDKLIKIVGLSLLNLIKITNLVKILEQELEVGPEKATEIAKKLDTNIFEKIREMIKNDSLMKDIQENEIKETRNAIEEVVTAVENNEKNSDEMSFKEKLKNVKIKKIEKEDFDPYLEPID